MEDVVSGFNKFLLSVGPEIAEKISDKGATDLGAVDDTGERNLSSVFLKTVKEKEIIDIVRKYKNKTYDNSKQKLLKELHNH